MWSQGVYRKSLCFPLNFAENPRLLFKNEVFLNGEEKRKERDQIEVRKEARTSIPSTENGGSGVLKNSQEQKQDGMLFMERKLHK